MGCICEKKRVCGMCITPFGFRSRRWYPRARRSGRTQRRSSSSRRWWGC